MQNRRSTAFLFILCLLIASGRLLADEGAPKYELKIDFDPGTGVLHGEGRILISPEGTVHLDPRQIPLSSFRLNGKEISHEERVQLEPGTTELEFAAKGDAGHALEKGGRILGRGSIINPRGAFLVDSWYPVPSELTEYSLEVVVPKGYVAISEARKVQTDRGIDGEHFRFEFSGLRPGLRLFVAKYVTYLEEVDGIEFATYLFEEDQALASDYIEASQTYLREYERLLGKYPYSRISIVETLFPAGSFHPTLIPVPQGVIDLPDARKGFLKRKWLEQWFGSTVYPDNTRGNWIEGLLSYLVNLSGDQADHDWRERKRLMLSYDSYVHKANAISLRQFTEKGEPATNAVGYAKGSMVFHMLRQKVGDEVFFGTLRQLLERRHQKLTSWDPIQELFEKESEEDLETFFSQWLDRLEIPRLAMTRPKYTMTGDRSRIFFHVLQDQPFFQTKLAVRIETDREIFSKTITLEQAIQNADFTIRGKPKRITLDPHYNIFRHLSSAERPPLLSTLFGNENRLVLLPEAPSESIQKAADLLTSRGFRPLRLKEVTDADLRGASILLFGADNRIVDRLFGSKAVFMSAASLPGAKPAAQAGIEAESPAASETSLLMEAEPANSKNANETLLVARANPLNAEKVVVAVLGPTDESLASRLSQSFFSSDCSSLRYEESGESELAVAEAAQGIQGKIEPAVRGLQPSQSLDLQEILQRIEDTPIIYVGESHTAFEDHRTQLEVIRHLQDKGKKFAIGMEMFQRPFQQALNDYILEKRTTEAEFLKSSEYFKRWKYNYFLYREILEFAREHGIRVVALNQESEIIRKISREGMDALDEAERQKTPTQLDMSDNAYKWRLREVFGEHAHVASGVFENFYQAQIMWDETMAESIADFMKANPEHQMVVLAGSGHIAYGSGIPKRTHRRNGQRYVTLLNASSAPPLAGIADYLIFAESLEAPSAPKIGVILGEKEGKVLIREVASGSLAAKMGLRAGDRLLRLNGAEIREIDDVTIQMLHQQIGNEISLELERPRTLLRPKQLVISAKLQGYSQFHSPHGQTPPSAKP